MVGIAIGLIVSALFIFTYTEGDVLDRVGGWFPLEISAGEPPTQEEVHRRAVALDSRGFIVGAGSMMCSAAPGLLADAEAKLKKRFPDVPGIKDLNAGYFTALPDTRLAMKVMDELEDLIDDLERACM